MSGPLPGLGDLRLARVVLRKELKDNLRDRRSMSSGFLMPLFGPLMFLAMMSLLARLHGSDGPLKLPVRGAENAPSLIAFLESHGAEVVPAGPGAEQLVRDGKLDVVLAIPASYAEEFSAGHTARVELIVDGSRDKSRAPLRRVHRLLAAYSSGLGSLRLLARGVAPALAVPVAVEEVDLATPERMAAAVLTMIPLFLLMAVFMGGMYLAIDSTAGERERGSLEPLLINPVTRTQVVLGKWAAVVLVSWAALLVSLTGFWLALQRAPLQELGIRAELGGATMLGLVLVLLPLSLLAAGLQMLLSLFARTFKEAQTYLQLMMLVPLLPAMMLSLSPIETKAWMMAVPMLGQTLLLGEVLRGNPVPPLFHLLALVATALAAAGTVAAAVRMLGQEKIVFGRGSGG